MLNRAPIASPRMAAPSAPCTLTVTARKRWWVRPLLAATLVAIQLGAPIRAAHVERLAAWIARRGVRYAVGA